MNHTTSQNRKYARSRSNTKYKHGNKECNCAF
ncbi:hypothetical protein MED222_05365 [Vibrio sp. MED222]|nr:hypothetical protein MED222_05365 [Vibrio sp. MED222]